MTSRRRSTSCSSSPNRAPPRCDGAHVRMVTTQSAVTVMAEILAGHEAPLRQLLEAAGQDAADNSLVPFGRLPNVHFARFFIMDAIVDQQGHRYSPRLIFLADIDGPVEPFLVALCTVAGDGLDTIYGHCGAYPGRAGLLNFLRTSTV